MEKIDKIEEILARGTANIIPSKEKLERLLNSGGKLNVYLGIDPTSPKIHLGHLVPLRKLQALSKLHHHVTFLIGDFTALIGDTSDKESERPSLTYKEIKHNFQTYKKQAEKFLDFSKVKIVYNSTWLKKLSSEDIIRLIQHFSAGDFYSRELIKKRLHEGRHVGLHEVLYPVMQGYDSYYLDTDIQIGGTDQTFNMQAGRTLQKDFRNKESFIIATQFLTGTDGRKMSKTWNNAIWVEDEPNNIYGKIMSLADSLIVEYFTLTTDLPMDKVQNIEKSIKNGRNPMQFKKQLAFHITSEIHGKAKAEKAQEYFEKTVQKRKLPKKIPQVTLPLKSGSIIRIIELLEKTKLVSSKSSAKRLLKEGAVEINEKQVRDPKSEIRMSSDIIVRVGKRKFVKLRLKDSKQIQSSKQ